MEGPFKEMAEEGVPAAPQPTEVSKPQKEEQDLPELSAQEFRIYNRMAEHMDMFVSSTHRSNLRPIRSSLQLTTAPASLLTSTKTFAAPTTPS